MGTSSLGAVPAAPEAGTTARVSTIVRQRLTWLWPALLTLAITAHQLDRAPLWRDELATWSAASRPLPDLFRLTAQIDGVTAPYYLLMHGWIAAFGDSPTALRIPALLGMAGAAALTTRLGERLFDTRTGLLAGLLFAVVPSTSRYGQEARGYALATLLSVTATLLLLNALARPDARRWAGYAASVAGLGLTHLVSLILLSGQAVAVLGAARRDPELRCRRRWLIALAPVALLLTPVALLGHRQQDQQLAWVSPPSLGDLCTLPGAVLQTGAVGGILVGLAILGAVQGGRAGALLGLGILAPVALLFLGGLVTELWVPRYLVVLVPFACLLAASALAPLRLRAALPVVAVVCLLGAPTQAHIRRTHEWPRDRPVDYQRAAAVITTHRLPGDGIVFSPRDRWAYLDIAASYYLGRSLPRDVLLADDPVRRAAFWATECDRPAECLTGVDRLWLLVRGEHDDPFRRMPSVKRDALRGSYTVDRTWAVPGLTVALLTRRN